MLDQSYNFKNFLKIFKEENHKGNFSKEFYSDDFISESNKVAEFRKIVKEAKKSGNSITELVKELENIDANKTLLLENDLIGISDKINEPNFCFDLSRFYDSENEEYIYTLKKTPENFYAMKHLIKCMKSTFGVRHSNRDLATSQISLLLKDNSPKIIVKTDIKRFYESINQNRLLEIINDNQLLSPKSKKLLKSILYQYNIFTNQNDLELNKRNGIPRGLGISAYLAELYMRDVDKKVKEIENVFFYVRYVDDIIIAFTPSHKLCDDDYIASIQKIVELTYLELNHSKTKAYNTQNGFKSDIELPFLGYCFRIGKDGNYKSTGLTAKKTKRYKSKIDLAFEKYHVDKIHDACKASTMLINRINYLTKNVRLNRPKRGLIGVYFSNKLLDDKLESLKELDSYLDEKINNFIHDPNFSRYDNSVCRRLRKMSFQLGFSERQFFNMQSKKKKFFYDNPKGDESATRDKFMLITYLWK